LSFFLLRLEGPAFSQLALCLFFFGSMASALDQGDDIPLAQLHSATLPDAQEPYESDDEQPLATDAFLVGAAEGLGHIALCRLCGQRCLAADAVAKYKSDSGEATKYRCKKCNSVSVMLHRNMKWPPHEFSELDESEQMAFWKSCHETSSGGRFKYESIRAQLIKRMTHRIVHERSAEETSEPKPLSVWAQMGYPTKEIEENGTKSFHSVLGWVYEVPMLKTSRKVLLQEIEDRVTQAEQAVKERVGKHEMPECLEAAAGTSQPASKKAKKDPTAANEAKKQLAELKKHNSKVSSLATRVVNYLTKPMEEFKKTAAVVENNTDKLPAAMASGLLENFGKLKEYFDASSKAVKQAVTASAKGARLEELPFAELKTVQLLSNDLKADCKQAVCVLKVLKLL
jgi:hypothetical protein